MKNIEKMTLMAAFFNRKLDNELKEVSLIEFERLLSEGKNFERVIKVEEQGEEFYYLVK